MREPITVRLRKWAMGETPIPTPCRAILSEAADEIEAMTEENDRLQKLACSNCDVGCPEERRQPGNCEIIGTAAECRTQEGKK